MFIIILAVVTTYRADHYISCTVVQGASTALAEPAAISEPGGKAARGRVRRVLKGVALVTIIMCQGPGSTT